MVFISRNGKAGIYFCFMTDTKPIKRSEQLQPLSREHHDGLLFIWKLRQGINNNTDIEKLKAYTAWYWLNHIKPHFYQEEKFLMPFFSPGDPLSSRMREEHEDIRELIITIGHEPVKNDFTHLADLIESHIRFEERELFNNLELNLSQQELNDLNILLEEKPVSCKEEWREHFWNRSKIN